MKFINIAAILIALLSTVACSTTDTSNKNKSLNKNSKDHDERFYGRHER